MPSRYGGAPDVLKKMRFHWGLEKEESLKGERPIVTCKHCSRENIATDGYCHYCGEPISEKAEEKARMAEKARESTMQELAELRADVRKLTRDRFDVDAEAIMESLRKMVKDDELREIVVLPVDDRTKNKVDLALGDPPWTLREEKE